MDEAKKYAEMMIKEHSANEKNAQALASRLQLISQTSNLSKSLQNDSEKTPVIVVGIDTVNNNIVGVGACSIFKNNIGYLNSFRIKKEYRNIFDAKNTINENFFII